MYNLTLGEFQAIAGYLNAETDERPSEQSIKVFLNMSSALQFRLLKDLNGAEAKLSTAQRRLERLDEKEELFVAEYSYPELGCDSVDVAAALLWALQRYSYKVNITKLVHILYEVYAAWLGSHKERICVEHPVITAYGPQFWRVYRHFQAKVGEPMDKGAFDDIAGRFPGLARLIQNAAAKYHDMDDRDLKQYLIKSRPCQKAMPAKTEKEPKWNNPIDDHLIVLWKQGKL